jgi:hypothetical protein
VITINNRETTLQRIEELHLFGALNIAQLSSYSFIVDTQFDPNVDANRIIFMLKMDEFDPVVYNAVRSNFSNYNLSVVPCTALPKTKEEHSLLRESLKVLLMQNPNAFWDLVSREGLTENLLSIIDEVSSELSGEGMELSPLLTCQVGFVEPTFEKSKSSVELFISLANEEG